MKSKRIIGILILFLTFWSCRNDDDVLNGAEVVPPQTLSETLVVDEAAIQSYLQTHFYNYEEFETPPADFDYKIKIDTISGDNSTKTPLIDQMLTKSISVSSIRFDGIEEENDIQHTFYYLEVRPGQGIQPSIADSTYVRYKGSLLDGTTFDGATEIPVWFDLASIQGGGARGFAEGASLFKAGGDIVVNDDGTFSVENYGIGLVIFPSGLGYFNSAQTNIPAYSPLIFEIDLFISEESDHDRDGIPSIQEDINGNGYMFDEEDDTDDDNVPNYFDTDDDNDGTLTVDEDLEPDADLTVDRDGDGDKTNDLGDGNPLNDDTDGDGIPNYLDTDDTASRNDDS